MSFPLRIFLFALVPVIALFALQSSYPHLLVDSVGSVQLQADKIPFLRQFLPKTLPSRYDTPLVLTGFPHWSHYEKVAKVAVALAELGYPITFTTGLIFEDDVKRLHPNITFWPMLGKPDKMTAEEYEMIKTFEPGSAELGLFMMKKALVDGMPDQHETLQHVFRDHKDRYGNDKPLISLYDSVFVGHHPVLLGAPGVKPDASLSISCHPLVLDSQDSYPFYMGKSPASGANATAMHQEANHPDNRDYATKEVSKLYWDKLKELGATEMHDWHIYHTFATVPDYLMTMGVPQFEFPRSDLRPNVHYFGGPKTPKKAASSANDLPDWWSDVAAAKQDGKKIVAVSQGTLAADLSELLIPTLEALKDRTDVLVVATTVAMEVEDVPGLVLPSNARIAKFVPYDKLLPQVRYCIPNIHTSQVLMGRRSMFSSTTAATVLLFKVYSSAYPWSLRVKVKTRI
jgi:hypothetical protein